ncbi:MAG TPA: ABC transporter substrate-binding protein [Myxococcales bacterium]|nr:ABC transporter substrate-binding protein [Myxococcales bacterium]
MRLLALLFALSLPAVAAPPPEACCKGGSASAAVKSANDRVRAALDKYFKAPPGPAKEKARSEAREAVGSLLDFQSIAQATMDKHWAELKADQRVRYTNALRGAMEANYLTKMQQGQVDMSKVHNEMLGEGKQGDKTLVKTRVVTGKDSAQVDYLLERGKKGWKAVDVITEGVSLVDTYLDQVNRLLPKKGVNGVIEALERAKKRLEEQQDKPTAAAEPSGGGAATEK